MLIPRAAPNRVRLFFVACGGDKNGAAENKSGRGQECAVKRAECAEYVEHVEYVNHVRSVPLFILRKRGLRQRHRQMQKEATHAEVPLRPLPTTNRLPLHVATARLNSGTSPTGTSHSLQNLAPNTIDATDGVYPRPAPPPLSPYQSFPPRRGSLRTSFLLPLPIPVSANRSSTRWHVGQFVPASAHPPSPSPASTTPSP